MADTRLYIIGEGSHKVKLENESARRVFVRVYKEAVSDNANMEPFEILRENEPALIIPAHVLRERTYVETA